MPAAYKHAEFSSKGNRFLMRLNNVLDQRSSPCEHEACGAASGISRGGTFIAPVFSSIGYLCHHASMIRNI